MSPRRLIYKIIAAGDGGVGKTSLLQRYVDDKFSADTKMTIGTNVFHKDITLKNDILCSLQLWDFGGQARFRFLLDTFVRGTSGSFLMFDLTDYDSFENLQNWEPIVRMFDPTVPTLLLGCKNDLEDLIVVDDESALEFAKENNLLGYHKISSKTGYNVNKVFVTLVNIITNYKGISTTKK
jgi:small GTP-binding protein